MKDGFLVKRIKKTSSRRMWLCVVIAVMLMPTILGQIQNLILERKGIAEFTEESQVYTALSPYTPIKITTDELSEYEVVYKDSTLKFIFPVLKGDVKTPIVVSDGFVPTGEYYGYFGGLTAEDRQYVIDGLISQGVDQETAESMMPEYFFFNMKKPVVDWTVFITFAVGVVICIFFWVVSRINKKKPHTHKAFDALGISDGDVLENLALFEEEIKSKANFDISRIILTENWILYNGYMRIKLARLENIICAFKRRYKGNILMRPFTRRYDVVIGFGDKTQWVVKFGRRHGDIDYFKRKLKDKLPHIVCDDEDRVNAENWEKKPNEIFDQVSLNLMRKKNKEEIEKNKQEEKEQEKDEQ